MTSWHETRYRWQIWQAAKLQVGGGSGSSYVRWSNTPSIVENIRNIRSALALCDMCHIFPMQSYEIPDSEGFLWASEEFQRVKWSREIKFHQPAKTWFPLFPSLSVPITLYTQHFPGVDGLWLHGRTWHYLLSIYTMFLFSLIVLLPPRFPDNPKCPISPAVVKTFRLTGWWHASGES